MIVAAIQMTAGLNVEDNLRLAETLVDEAAADGAELVALPEYFSFYGEESRWGEASSMGEDILARMSRLAGRLGIHLLAGSVLLPSEVEGKSANVSVLFGSDGGLIARYQKIRLFDATTSAGRYRESDWLAPGSVACVARVGLWTLGMAICFDLRFPAHFARLRKMGANVVAVPSAFTYETGKDHWMTLIRARAIDNQCYIIAPALAGDAGRGRRCFGHSAVIGPWGEVLGVCEEGDGFVVAEMDFDNLEKIRKEMPLES